MAIKLEPDAFQSLAQVRAEIDQIDRAIVKLIGRRSLCVKAAARFKQDETAVAAPERFAAMLAIRREWAVSEGLDPDMVEELYRNMVTRFIAEEKNHWRSQQFAAVPEDSLHGGRK